MSSKSKKTGFANPEKNAKGCGILIVVLGILTFLGAIAGGAFVTGLNSVSYFGLLSAALVLIAGIGIASFKKYGLYMLLVLTAFEVLIFLYNLFVVGFFRLGFVIFIWPIVFFWLYQAKDKFK